MSCNPAAVVGTAMGRLCDGFFIIFQNQGEIRWVSDSRTDDGEKNIVLHPECRKGLYYFRISKLLTLIKVDEKWGAQFYLYNEMNSASLNFFPGDLSLTKGIACGGWECIKTLHNDSNSPITWSNKVTHKVGYAKQQMSSIEHSWSISTEMSL